MTTKTTRRAPTFYALEDHNAGFVTVYNGQRADRLHAFPTRAERLAWISGNARCRNAVNIRDARAYAKEIYGLALSKLEREDAFASGAWLDLLGAKNSQLTAAAYC